MSAAICKRAVRCCLALQLLCCFALACMGPLPAAARTPRWVPFHDPQTGLSFRYPPNLRVRRRDPRTFGLPRVESIVDLIGDTRTNPGTVVLRFLVLRGYLSPGARAKRREELRRGCKTISTLNLGGQKAVVCVSAGSAAIHWSVEILGPRECSILTLLGGADYRQSLPPPHDGEFPLLSIIRTVRLRPHRTDQFIKSPRALWRE
ncbi:MAG TPA: hypothetical protein VMW51_10430 [Terriglobia bacterium]|nr:hypothetical protein [Terriglobia bacterium]